MKTNQNIDELLNSFIDGELTQDQQSEVQQMIADAPQVARRLRELQACKALVSSLPHAEAPAGILDQIKTSLRAKAPQSQQPVYSASGETARFVLIRRVVAAAAVIALIAVLAAVIQTLIPSDVAPHGPGHEPKVATNDFGGRLELKTTVLDQVDRSINKAIHNNGLSDCVTPTQVDGRKAYSFRCTREGLHLLLADLDNVWRRFGSATLFVDTEQFGKPIVIDAVTAEQTAKVISQGDFKACAELAKDIAILNNVAESMPGKDLLAATGNGGTTLITIPKPSLTWHKETATDSASPPQDSEKVSLTIVVSGTE